MINLQLNVELSYFFPEILMYWGDFMWNQRVNNGPAHLNSSYASYEMLF